MSIYEIIVLGVALSMDAFAVGVTNGMAEPNMKARKTLLIALFYGAFQGIMPMLGYWGGAAFSSVVEKFAPWLCFCLLCFLGGKSIFECVKEGEERRILVKKKLTLGTLTAQAFATSIDALAVGVSLLAQQTMGALPCSVAVCALIIAIVTFVLSLVAVGLGKYAGNRFSGKAEFIGGAILILIGVKLLLDGIL